MASTRLCEFAAPQVKCHRSQILFAAAYEVVDEMVGGGFEGVGCEPSKSGSDDFFRISVEFSDEGRQQAERMTAQSAEQAPDRDGVGFRQSDQAAHIASVPAQAVLALADLALRRFGKLLFLKTPDVFVDLGFEQ